MSLKKVSYKGQYQEQFEKLFSFFEQVSVDGEKQEYIDVVKRLERAMEKLEYKVHRATKEKATLNALLKRTSEDLQSSLEVEQKFTASVSHEIRTPLNAIMGFIDLLSKTSLQSQQKEYIDHIQVSSKHLLSLINDVLDVSKIEAGQMELNESEVDLEVLLTECISFIAPKIKPDVRLAIEIEDLDFFVYADAVRLRQIFVNLLSNACKFTEKGEIKLSLLEYAARNEKQIWMKFCVSDTGIGIPKEKRHALFDAFSQAHKQNYGGTGLGLYLSNALANVMSGTIYVESEVGKGSRFYIEVLLTKGSRREERFHFEDRHVLFYENDPDFAEKIIDKLTTSHARVVSRGKETSIKQLTELVLEQQFDVLILDESLLGQAANISMEFFQQLFPKMLIILTSVHQQEANQEVIRLKKPFPYKSLAKIIDSHSSDNDKLTTDFSHLKILLVEDVKMNMILVREMLKKFFNASFDHAENGELAVEMVKNTVYDIVFMDIQMPVMDGIEATRLIREFNTTVPVYAMTANVLAEDNEKALQAGMNGFIHKPIKKEFLLKALQSVLN